MHATATALQLSAGSVPELHAVTAIVAEHTTPYAYAQAAASWTAASRTSRKKNV